MRKISNREGRQGPEEASREAKEALVQFSLPCLTREIPHRQTWPQLCSHSFEYENYFLFFKYPEIPRCTNNPAMTTAEIKSNG
jgi:hypothetical protein